MGAPTFFKDFDPVSAKAWKQKIQYGLKGADYNEQLVWESPEGIKVKPFYHREDLAKLTTALGARVLKWRIGESILAADAKIANEKATKVLKKGIESLFFTISDETVAAEQLLLNIDLHTVPLHFQCQFLSPDYLKKAVPLLSKKGAEGSLNLDPIGHLARTGNWFHTMEQDFAYADEIVKMFPTTVFGSGFSVDATGYQNAGANRVQELAYTLCHANEYLNHNGDHPCRNIHFTVAMGGNYFFEVAKVRALRMLWGVLAKAHGITGDCHITAVPSHRNKTIYDYNTNLLRTTTECMAAVLGGANTVCNLTYDTLYHKDNDFGNRIARNQLLLLKHESFFEEKDNPVTGSYYIESLVQQLAQKALELFKDIESKGGFLKQLKNHTIQRKIKESAHKEQLRFDQAQEVLVGTNKYVQENERMKDALERSPFMKTHPRKTLIEPILPKRLAASMEKERLKKEGMTV